MATRELSRRWGSFMQWSEKSNSINRQILEFSLNKLMYNPITAISEHTKFVTPLIVLPMSSFLTHQSPHDLASDHPARDLIRGRAESWECLDVKMVRCEMCQIVSPGWDGTSAGDPASISSPLTQSGTSWTNLQSAMWRLNCYYEQVNRVSLRDLRQSPYWPVRRDIQHSNEAAAPLLTLVSETRVRIPSCIFRSSLARARSTT